MKIMKKKFVFKGDLIMNTIIFPEDVDNVIQSFILVNNGDEATENLILAIGAELLDISVDTMAERISFAKEVII